MRCLEERLLKEKKGKKINSLNKFSELSSYRLRVRIERKVTSNKPKEQSNDVWNWTITICSTIKGRYTIYSVCNDISIYCIIGKEKALMENKKEIEILQGKISSLSVQLLARNKANEQLSAKIESKYQSLITVSYIIVNRSTVKVQWT